MDIDWKYGNKFSPREIQQDAMANFLEKWTSEGLPSELDLDQATAYSPRTPQIANEMVGNYISARSSYLAESEVLSIEQPFAVPMPNHPHTWYVGRLDKVLTYRGQTIVLEHKTTALYRKEGNFESNWADSWNVDSQVIGYEIA